MNRQVTEIVEAVARGVAELAALYANVIARMIEAEFRALRGLIDQDKREAAEMLLLANMTNDELVAHKRFITNQAVQMASEQADADKAGRDAAWAIVKVIVGAAGAVLL